MKRILMTMILLSLLAPMVLAGGATPTQSGTGSDAVSASRMHWWDQLFAIGFDSGRYDAGETVEATFGVTVPCDTQWVIFNVNTEDGQNIYYKDVSTLFDQCTTSNTEYRFTAPDASGDYEVTLTFYNGQSSIIFTDRAVFTVGTQDCPYGYCTGWDRVERVTNGWLEQKTCYVVNQNTCAQTPIKENRIDCDSGYEQTGSSCVAQDGSASCGNGVREGNEDCDRGFNNGVCPNSCSASCEENTCGDESDDIDDGPGGDDGKAGIGLAVLFGILIMGGAVLLIIFGVVKK